MKYLDNVLLLKTYITNYYKPNTHSLQITMNPMTHYNYNFYEMIFLITSFLLQVKYPYLCIVFIVPVTFIGVLGTIVLLYPSCSDAHPHVSSKNSIRSTISSAIALILLFFALVMSKLRDLLNRSDDGVTEFTLKFIGTLYAMSFIIYFVIG